MPLCNALARIPDFFYNDPRSVRDFGRSAMSTTTKQQTDLTAALKAGIAAAQAVDAAWEAGDLAGAVQDLMYWADHARNCLPPPKRRKRG